MCAWYNWKQYCSALYRWQVCWLWLPFPSNTWMSWLVHWQAYAVTLHFCPILVILQLCSAPLIGGTCIKCDFVCLVSLYKLVCKLPYMHGNIVGDAFWSHNQNKGHVFEDDENKATVVALSKQRVKILCVSSRYYRLPNGLMLNGLPTARGIITSMLLIMTFLKLAL